MALAKPVRSRSKPANGSERPSGDDCFPAVVRRLAATLVFGLVFGALASAQDRMPPIPADKLTPAQKKIVDEYKQARGGEPGGPWAVLTRSPELM